MIYTCTLYPIQWELAKNEGHSVKLQTILREPLTTVDVTTANVITADSTADVLGLGLGLGTRVWERVWVRVWVNVWVRVWFRVWVRIWVRV